MAEKREGFCKEVREQVAYAQGCYCKLCESLIRDYHHKWPNTKPNRKNYPLFIHSVFNCVGLCRKCHEDESWRFNMNLVTATMYETALEEIRDGVQK